MSSVEGPAERTRLVWERPAAYPAPPLPPLPAPDDLAPFADLGVRVDAVSRPVLRAASALSGLAAFRRELPERLDGLLHATELRGGILSAPALSATLALRDDPRDLSAAERAATLVLAARSLAREVRAGTLPPDRLGDQVLEMALYTNLFSTSLIVENVRSRLFKSDQTRRIHVVAGGRLFALDLPDLAEPAAGDPSPPALAAALAEIARDAAARPLPPDAVPPGLLSAAPHGLQIRLLDRLARVPANREALESLRHGFLVLCLDFDHAPADAAEIAAHTHFAHPENRWYAASLQLVVFGNAKAGAIASFSAYLDGNVMMRAGAELQQRAAEVRLGANAEAGAPLPPARELRWEIPAADGDRVRKALLPFRDEQPATFEIAGFGRSFFTARGAAPIPAFGLALQLAADRLAGRPVEISQLVAQSAWRCADLAAAAVSTPEVRRFAEQVRRSERVNAAQVREALDSQRRAVREARSRLDFEIVLGLFLHTRTGFARTRAVLTSLAGGLLLSLLRRAPSGRDVVISHPALHPEVPLLGRPGVRLPYLRCFGLHYQMLDGRTVLTVMPGAGWTVPNAALAAALTEELARVGQMLGD